MKKIERDDTVYGLEYVLHSEALKEIDEMQAEIDRLHSERDEIASIERERCAQKCERRANSLRDGSDVARLCARDIRNGAAPSEEPKGTT